MSQIKHEYNDDSMFVIDGYDLTRLIVGKSYKVSMHDKYVSWTDGTHTERRDVVARKASGSFKMVFHSVDDYDEFIRLIEDNKRAGAYVPARFYLNNEKRLYSGNFYIDFELVNNRPFIYTSANDQLEVKITER